jgi:hypothetical protein
VLSEEQIANNHLLTQTHFGGIFAYGDGADVPSRVRNGQETVRIETLSQSPFYVVFKKQDSL